MTACVVSDRDQKYRPAFAARDRYNGVILRIGDKFIKLGKDTKSLLLVQGIADRWNDREPLPRWLTMVDGG